MITHDEYMNFFKTWIFYQFDRTDDELLNNKVLREVAHITADTDDLTYWANRDCWSMYDLAKQNITKVQA